MKFSEQWLREWVNPSCNTKELAEQLTMMGLEVDSVMSAGMEFTHVVIGRVIACEKHPDVERLNRCQVDVGQSKILSIICGGINVRVGLKVPVALIGARLPGNIKIKKMKIRGHVSEGMICASRELELGGRDEPKGGIMELPPDAPIGKDLREYLQLQDSVIDIDLTPNRGDCLSIRGIARDVAIVNELTVQEPEITIAKIYEQQLFPIRVSATQACPRYTGRVIHDINQNAHTPIWMQERLRRSGLRCIHPVVDICNYVMLELGQPLHAFDLDTLDSEIQVRSSKFGERIKLIDGNEVSLQTGTLVIADRQRSQAIAGIMGALSSAVDGTTKNIFLESAYFDPVNIRLNARRYTISTDSSYRYERGVDYCLQGKANERATQLILKILGGKAGPMIEVASEIDLPKAPVIHLRKAKIERVLGIIIENKRVESILVALGMHFQSTSEGWRVIVPSYRFDITQEIDLIEELARIHGYDRIPVHLMYTHLKCPTQSEIILTPSRIAKFLVDQDYQEVINYSFVDDKVQSLIIPHQRPIKLANPLTAEMEVMRMSLWPNLIQTMVYNLNRQCPRVRLFEMGLCFQQTKDELLQKPVLALLVTGEAYPEQWSIEKRSVDFYDIKGDVERLLDLTRRRKQFSWCKGTHPALHPGQSADLYQEDRRVGYLGAIHPKITQHLELIQVPFLFEVDLLAVEAKQLPRYEKISKFPTIRRDIAIIVDEDISADEILQRVKEKAGQLLNEIHIFDIYQGECIEKNKKSVALGLTFQDPSRTLIDEEINALIQNVVAHLECKINAKLRA